MNGNEELIFIGNHNLRNPMINKAINSAALRVTGYDNEVEVCDHGFRAMACNSFIEPRL